MNCSRAKEKRKTDSGWVDAYLYTASIVEGGFLVML
jgi:hypothetical protein